MRHGALPGHQARREFGLRVKDANAPTRTHFQGLDYFPIDAEVARRGALRAVQPAEEDPDHGRPRHDQRRDLAGRARVHARRQGVPHRSDPRGGDDDSSSSSRTPRAAKRRTRPAATSTRKPPDRTARRSIDFNKAYNPPCAFTPFATCPLPPLQNRLPIRIEAGEKRYAGDTLEIWRAERSALYADRRSSTSTCATHAVSFFA